MKLNIPIEVVFDDLNSMIDELGKLQKYKFGEGDDMTLVDVCDVADILMRHVKGREAKRGTHWIPCSEMLPEDFGEYLVTKKAIGWNCEEYNSNDISYFDNEGFHKADKVLAWMPLSEPYGGESDD